METNPELITKNHNMVFVNGRALFWQYILPLENFFTNHR